jgi:type VI secretion system protein ImpJ
VTNEYWIPDAVQWHEGMLLSPQHFQQADLRADALRGYLAQATTPFGWGVRRWDFDKAALEAGRFSLTELEAIMPDGLLILYPTAEPANAPALDLDLKPLLANGAAQSLAVHVTVAAQSWQSERAGTGKKQRFREVVGAEVADANTGDNAILIPRLLPNLVLERTDGPLNPPSPARLVSLPLAILKFDGQRFTKSDDFEAPRLRVADGTLLFNRAKGVETALAAMANDWAGRLRGALAEGQAALVSDSIVTLRTVIRGLPRLAALLKTRTAHPFDVYLALCDIAGNLAVVGGELTNPDFDSYQHADPLPAFTAVTEFISKALERLHTPYTSEDFEQVKAGEFKLTLGPVYLRDEKVLSYLRDKLVIGVRLRRSQKIDAVRQWFLTARIGAVDDIATLNRNMSAGVARDEIRGTTDLGVLPQPLMLLFSVGPEELLASGQALQISLSSGEEPGDDFGEGASEPDQITLFLPAPEPGPGPARGTPAAPWRLS